MKAVWNDTVIAESDNTEVVEGNHYFPKESVNMEYLIESDKTYDCPWKGHANYYSIQVGDETNQNSAWTYEEPKEKALNIKEYFAFEGSIKISE